VERGFVPAAAFFGAAAFVVAAFELADFVVAAFVDDLAGAAFTAAAFAGAALAADARAVGRRIGPAFLAAVGFAAEALFGAGAAFEGAALADADVPPVSASSLAILATALLTWRCRWASSSRASLRSRSAFAIERSCRACFAMVPPHVPHRLDRRAPVSRSSG
jgi:hypothetical protein